MQLCNQQFFVGLHSFVGETCHRRYQAKHFPLVIPFPTWSYRKRLLSPKRGDHQWKAQNPMRCSSSTRENGEVVLEMGNWGCNYLKGLQLHLKLLGAHLVVVTSQPPPPSLSRKNPLCFPMFSWHTSWHQIYSWKNHISQETQEYFTTPSGKFLAAALLVTLLKVTSFVNSKILGKKTPHPTRWAPDPVMDGVITNPYKWPKINESLGL